MEAINDEEYVKLEDERRKCNDTQLRLLKAALHQESQGEVARLLALSLDPRDVAAASGLERRGLVVTHRPEKGHRSCFSRPKYRKGTRRAYRLTQKGRAVAQSLPNPSAGVRRESSLSDDNELAAKLVERAQEIEQANTSDDRGSEVAADLLRDAAELLFSRTWMNH